MSPTLPRLLVAVVAAVLSWAVPTAHAWSAAELSRLDACQLEQAFSQGQVCAAPVGAWRGRVVLRVDTALPRARACLANVAWKGKYFRCDGTMVNQWVGFRAVESGRLRIEPSWHDGRPCFVLDYAPDAAIFSNARDELREVAPGVLLGRFYERCPCPRLQGYFVLEAPRGAACR